MILMIVIILLFIVFIFQGYKQGFAKVAFSLIAWLIGIVAAYILTPVVAEVIYTHTELPIAIETAIYDQITNTVGELNIEGIESLPTAVQDMLLGDYESLDALIQAGALEVIDVAGMTSSIINMIALVIVLLGSRLILVVVETFMGGISKLPLVGPVNKLLGATVGIVKGLLWSWITLVIVHIATFTGYNTTLMAQITESSFLTWLYENNLILNLFNSFI